MADKMDKVRGGFPKLKVLIVVGDHRDGWLNYEEEVSKASSDFDVENTRSDDSCTLYFTSGTTGMPKMTLHTHASYTIGHLITGKYWHDLGPDLAIAFIIL